MLQVQRHAELVPQPIKGRHRDVVGPFPSELHTAQAKVGCVVSGWIAPGRVLDLDDPRAEAGEEESGDRPRQCNCEVENRKVAEGRFFRSDCIHDAAADSHSLRSRVNPTEKSGEPPGVSALLVIEVPLSPTRAFATFALSFPLLRSRQMTRNRLIFTLISLGLVAAVVGGYILLPRQYKVGRRLNETIVFWNDQQAFFFLNTFTVGQSSNFVSERLGKTSYGYLLSLLLGSR